MNSSYTSQTALWYSYIKAKRAAYYIKIEVRIPHTVRDGQKDKKTRAQIYKEFRGVFVHKYT